jgi:hypothetical protein
MLKSNKVASLSFGIFAMFLLAAYPAVTEAQVGEDVTESPYSPNQRNKATIAVVRHLTFESGLTARHCRDRFAPMGCETRVRTLVDRLFVASARYHIDPWLVVALAVENTNFDPFHIENSVATGILGIPFHSSWRRNDQFFRNPDYRYNCRNENDACQENIIDRSVRELATAIDRCERSARAGIRMYANGRCTQGARFARHVLRQKRRLQRMISDVADIDNCAGPWRMICESDPIGGMAFDHVD